MEESPPPAPQKIHHSTSSSPQCVIVIGGQSTAGKSTIANWLMTHIFSQHNAICYNQDDYYKPRKDIPMQPLDPSVKDSPLCTNWDILESLKSESFEKTIFSTMNKYDIVIIQGHFCGFLPNILKKASICIYLSVDEQIGLERRLARKNDLYETPDYYFDKGVSFPENWIQLYWKNFVLPLNTKQIKAFSDYARETKTPFLHLNSSKKIENIQNEVVLFIQKHSNLTLSKSI